MSSSPTSTMTVNLQSEGQLSVKGKCYIAALLLLQFMFWFRPLTPYLIPFLSARANVTFDFLDNAIFPVWTWTLPAAALIQAFLAEVVVGYRVALVLTCIFALAESVITLNATTIPLLYVSQIFAALYFSAVFVIIANFLHLVHERYYRVVFAANIGTSLLANLLSSGLALGLHRAGMASELLSYIQIGAMGGAVLAAILAALLRDPNANVTGKWSGWLKDFRATWHTVACVYSDGPTLMWAVYLVFAGSALALADTFYQFCLLTIDPAVELGVVSLSAYGTAAVATLVPAAVELYRSRTLSTDSDEERALLSKQQQQQQRSSNVLHLFVLVALLGCVASVALMLMPSLPLIGAAAMYITAHVCLQAANPTASAVFAQMVNSCERRSYAAALGLNSAVALLIQAIAQALIHAARVGIFGQMRVFAGAVFVAWPAVLIGAFLYWRSRRS
eukprot:TRINITY_DN12826_c0_g1_i1.p1 TRINITY_DN12826_c0_g1~~TRINITY_DN12826_c0_g1_i1.p1  ORF type:complete len:448 (-),score=92.83 TRINITY_DN12826_c0_g1_i1:158-1501(-)